MTDQPDQPTPRDLPCTHPATLTVTGRPGTRWCPTCSTFFTTRPDGTLLTEVTGR